MATGPSVSETGQIAARLVAAIDDFIQTVCRQRIAIDGEEQVKEFMEVVSERAKNIQAFYRADAVHNRDLFLLFSHLVAVQTVLSKAAYYV